MELSTAQEDYSRTLLIFNLSSLVVAHAECLPPWRYACPFDGYFPHLVEEIGCCRVCRNDVLRNEKPLGQNHMAADFPGPAGFHQAIGVHSVAIPAFWHRCKHGDALLQVVGMKIAPVQTIPYNSSLKW